MFILTINHPLIPPLCLLTEYISPKFYKISPAHHRLIMLMSHRISVSPLLFQLLRIDQVCKIQG